MKRIVVIGGGISGLTAAFYLDKWRKENEMPLDMKLLEGSGRLGGKIHTFHQEGFVVERGADSFLARKKPGMQLMADLGLENQLYRNETGQSYVLVNNQLKKIPAGSYMGIPVQEAPFMDADIVTQAGKERAMEELTVPKGEAQADQSLGGFLRRRFGDELVDHLLAPLLSGIYSSDIDEMSLMASFPNFYELEQTYGSVLQGLRETLPANRATTGKKAGQFVSIAGGLTTIIDALEKELGSTIHKETEIKQIMKNENTYILYDQHGHTYEADAVIVATPHRTVPQLLNQVEAFAPLDTIPVTSVANVVLAFKKEDIDQAMDGTGFVVSSTSDVRITACTWTHEKWPETTPDGKALLRAYVGRPNDQEIVKLNDQEITKIVLDDLKKVMDIEAQPEFTAVTRWQGLMPQYTVGHEDKVKQVKQAAVKQYPGVFLTGASYHGVGLPDCIGQAKQTGEEVISYFND